MPLPDLSAAQAAVEDLMVDTCEVRQDPGGTRDDDLDPDTLKLVPGQDPTYEGRCRFGDGTVSLPLGEAPELREGDRVKCTSSVRDPAIVGKVWRVSKPIRKTIALSRRAELEYRPEDNQ